MFRYLLSGLTVSCLVLIAAYADDGPELQPLTRALGGVEPDFVGPSPVAGLYEVVVGSQILYVSEDGRYAINGSVIDVAEGRDVTEPRRAEIRAGMIEQVGEDRMVVFEPNGRPVNHTVTVFTDIDCGYCRKLHAEIQDYTNSGIRVRYLFYPRSGLKTPSYDKAVTVWCSGDRREALTRAKQGQHLKNLTCPNPVEDHYQLGGEIGVRGTPAILLDNGQMLPGYVPADRLSAILDAS